MLDVYLVLRNVRPGVRAAAAVALHEVDGDGAEHERGFHAMTSPAHHDPAPRDVALPRVRFVMPEDLRPADGPASCAGCRHFVVRTHSRYVDAADL